MKRTILISLTAALLAASSASAFDFIASPIAGTQAPSATNYDFNTTDVRAQDTTGLPLVDGYTDFGPQISLIETGTRDRAGFRAGVGYDISGSSAPTVDGGARSTVGAFADRYGNDASAQRLSGTDNDDVSLNAGFSLNF